MAIYCIEQTINLVNFNSPPPHQTVLQSRDVNIATVYNQVYNFFSPQNLVADLLVDQVAVMEFGQYLHCYALTSKVPSGCTRVLSSALYKAKIG